MATAASDSDVDRDNGNEGEGEDCDVPDMHKTQDDRQKNPTSEGSRSEDPSRKPQPSQSRRQIERTVSITETQTETIQGLDDLSSCINSVDDHVQAGLQELRNCVANLRKDRTEMSTKVRTLTEEVHQISSERDHYQLAIGELQQEVSILREQLCNQQQDKEALLRRMQEMQQRQEDHLVNIAGKQRSKRLAHNAIVHWRRKTLDKGLGCREQLHILEEENNQLRAELLLCQEAAKQAFLRSANVLNSEAITMFQDAATRRLGFEETSSQGSQASHDPSPPNSPDPHPNTSQGKSGAIGGGLSDNKENIYKDGRSTGTGHGRRHTDGRERPVNEGSNESDDDRSYVATYGSNDQNHMNICHGSHSSADINQRTRVNYGNREGYGNYGYESDSHHPPPGVRPYIHHPASEDYGAVGGRVPPQNRPANVSEFEPDALQQETRAYLQQLRDERQRRADPASGFESQRKTQKTAQSRPNPKCRPCSCKSRGTVTDVPYKCPYCTPIQNSSFGHAKDVSKKTSNVTRNTILSSTNVDKKKVIYKPSASTVVIEKHFTR